MTLPYAYLGLRDESLAMERLDGEVIIVDFESGHYYSFQSTAADILWLIDHQVKTDRWPMIFEAAYANFEWPEVREGILIFLNKLIELSLITPGDVDSSAIIDLPNDSVREGWTEPVMLVNDELADLLVIDPIHDVSDDGWPATPSN